MKIGTPLSPSATKVMLLGSGELGKEVVISLQRLGIEVIAVDRYENAPAHQVAHRSHVIDMTNKEQLEKIIMQEKPHYIVPEIEAINTAYLKEVEETQSIVIVPSVKAVQLTMNREGIRRLAAEDLKIPTSPYGFASNIEELKAIAKKVGFPCFIKPTMSSSGKGQSKINSAEEIDAAWIHAATAGRVNEGKVILEGMIDFDYEITLLTVRAKNNDGIRLKHFFVNPLAIGRKMEIMLKVGSHSP
jgi:phosphoribosylglycinamide formyltransferase 2